MNRTKTVALTGLLALAGVGFACTSNQPAATNAANANKPAATAPAPTTATAPTTPTAAVSGLEGAGLQAFNAKCSGCHGPDANGTKAAPGIVGKHEAHTSAEWQAYLKNPKIWEKDNSMPAVKLTDEESKLLGDWLAAVTGKGGAKSDEHEGKEKAEKSEGVKKS